ncbi:MAG: methylmalonyl-CoA mutase family protein [Bacteroidota bacterium]|nr:methylmalonyl-CoA mutase family protein [Bacteroidota bacterium]
MKNLFSEFNPISAGEWKAQLIKDLKGDSYESLIWQNENGFSVKPFYTSEDLLTTYSPVFTHTDWDICVKTKEGDSKQINAQLLKDLNLGSTSISVNCDSINFELVLKDIQLNYISSTFYIHPKDIEWLTNYLSKNYKLNELNLTLFPKRLENQKDLNYWETVISLFSPYKNIKTISVDALIYHNQNCFAYYEVAIIFSALNECLTHQIVNTKADVVVKTGVSSDYFIQIAKLRAIRRLWEILKKEYGLSNNLYIITETSLTNKSISDSYNNLLRTTIESMAAVAGGSNELIVNSFDILFSQNNKLGERMAINQQLILKEESYLNKMADVSCGSFYIESITDAIAEKALESIKKIEEEGGYFKCLEKKVFETEMNKQANQKTEAINSQQQISVGVNKFKNEKENIKMDDTALDYLKKLNMNNPVLNFELQNILKHA